MTGCKNILFDLDGTLTDPAQGIIRSIQYSLEVLKLPCPPASQLTAYIGPPLRECFISICDSSDKALVERAITVFRERFSTIGLFENTVYGDIHDMLAELQKMSYQLFVATSKPQLYAERILNHFSLASYFVEIHGNDLEGSLDDKARILELLIAKHSLSPKETIMVGDRMHDIIAARSNNISSLAVTYGYGSREELLNAGADYLCDDPLEVLATISELRKTSCPEDGSSVMC